MNAAIIKEELMRLRLNPPVATGLVRRSPKAAPSGRVRMNADQNINILGGISKDLSSYSCARFGFEIVCNEYAAARNTEANQAVICC